jgi:XTP/dITP diphosphohydrolase
MAEGHGASPPPAGAGSDGPPAAATGSGAPPHRLLIATTNAGKQREYRRLLAPLPLALVTPDDIGLTLAVDEDGDSFAANAVLKARGFAAASGLPALADDSGLEVDALGGLPGVHSSRWAGGGDVGRVAALLARLADVPDAARTARFRAVAALAWPDGRVATAEGTVTGRIARAPRGGNGFGYDPVFLVGPERSAPGSPRDVRAAPPGTDAALREGEGAAPPGRTDEALPEGMGAALPGRTVASAAGDRTVAELDDAEKDAVSHRGRAVRALWPVLVAVARGDAVGNDVR